MPPRTQACCRALQRQLVTPSDSIWLSDDVLSNAFARFCAVSQTAKRYGSYVPGPMECRRRLGRRRMTNLTEAVPTPSTHLGATWGFFGDVDRTQWQWEAPTQPRKHQPEKVAEPALPDWLLNWNTAPQMEDVKTFNDGQAESLEETITPERIISKFGETLHKSLVKPKPMLERKTEILCITETFNAEFAKQLALGTVSQDTLRYALQQVTKDLCSIKPQMGSQHELCFKFYTSIWRGIVACKVLRPVDFDSDVLNSFILLISRLPMGTQVRTLAQEILISASGTQLQRMENGVSSLIKKWLRSSISTNPMPRWAEQTQLVRKPWIHDIKARTQDIAEFALKSHKRLLRAQRLATTHNNGSIRPIFAAKKHLRNARAIHLQIEKDMLEAERILSPWKTSITMLAKSLINIPADSLSRIAFTCSEDIVNTCLKTRCSYNSLRYSWLFTVSEMPNADEKLFVETWQKMEIQEHDTGHGWKDLEIGSLRFDEGQSSDLVLNHWISHGHVRNIAEVRNRYEACAKSIHGSDRNFASLVLAFVKYESRGFSRIRDLFRLLDQLQRFSVIYDILRGMITLKLKIPVTILSQVIETMSTSVPGLRKPRPEHALRILNMSHKLRPGAATMNLESMPNFIIGLVNHHDIPSSRIWEILRIPPYKLLHHHGELCPEHSPLSPKLVALIHQMALAFAYAKYRTPRSAVENIEQCLWHLRMHRAPIGPEISKALCHATVTREIQRGNWVVTQRLKYVLTIIERLEGKEVAEKVDMLVVRWREHLQVKQIGEKQTGRKTWGCK